MNRISTATRVRVGIVTGLAAALLVAPHVAAQPKPGNTEATTVRDALTSHKTCDERDEKFDSTGKSAFQRCHLRRGQSAAIRANRKYDPESPENKELDRGTSPLDVAEAAQSAAAAAFARSYRVDNSKNVNIPTLYNAVIAYRKAALAAYDSATELLVAAQDEKKDLTSLANAADQAENKAVKALNDAYKAKPANFGVI